jgi:hypothetical protein
VVHSPAQFDRKLPSTKAHCLCTQEAQRTVHTAGGCCGGSVSGRAEHSLLQRAVVVLDWARAENDTPPGSHPSLPPMTLDALTAWCQRGGRRVASHCVRCQTLPLFGWNALWLGSCSALLGGAPAVDHGRLSMTDQKSGSRLNPLGLSRRQVRRSVISNSLPSSFRSSSSVTTGTGNSGCSAALNARRNNRLPEHECLRSACKNASR